MADRIAALEEAAWGTGAEARSARAVSIYQLRNGLIHRVWYVDG